MFYYEFYEDFLNSYSIDRSSRPDISVKKVFLKFLQNSQENICSGFSFYKVAGLQVCNFIKKRL